MANVAHKPRVLTSLRIAVWFVLMLTPLLLTTALLRWSYQATWLDLAPVWSDEFLYWHQVETFREVGFEGGYYTVREQPAPVFSRFYAWGPAMPALYGSLARLTGWTLASMPLMNMAFLMAGLALAIALARPTLLQSLLWMALLATSGVLYLYAPSSLTEIMQMGLAIALGALGGVLIRQPRRTGLFVAGAIALLIVAASLRLTWALYAVPIFGLLGWRWGWRGLLGGLALGLLFAGIVGFGLQRLNAPWPNVLSRIMLAWGRSPEEGIQRIIQNMSLNLDRLDEGDLTEVFMRQATLILALAVPAWALVSTVWRGWRQQAWPAQDWRAALFHSITLLGVFAFIFTFYDFAIWRDYRQLSHGVLASGVALIVARPRWLAVPLIAAQLAILPTTATVINVWFNYHLNPEPPLEHDYWRRELHDIVVYDPDAPSPWCNTVLHTIPYLYSHGPLLMAFEAGIGLSSPLEQPTFAVPPRSRYLLIDAETYEVMEPMLDVIPLLEAPNGWLYLNQAADCDE